MAPYAELGTSPDALLVRALCGVHMIFQLWGPWVSLSRHLQVVITTIKNAELFQLWRCQRECNGLITCMMLVCPDALPYCATLRVLQGTFLSQGEGY